MKKFKDSQWLFREGKNSEQKIPSVKYPGKDSALPLPGQWKSCRFSETDQAYVRADDARGNQ